MRPPFAEGGNRAAATVPRWSNNTGASMRPPFAEGGNRADITSLTVVNFRDADFNEAALRGGRKCASRYGGFPGRFLQSCFNEAALRGGRKSSRGWPVLWRLPTKLQ